MNTRMDKYTETPSLKSRSLKNKNLYNEIKESDIDKFDIASNTTLLSEDAKMVDVDKIRDMLDRKYRESVPKKNIILEEKEEKEEENLHDTKEYDINAILDKARKSQNVDYEKERLKKVHDTQYDILKNLNIKDDEEIPEMEDNEENITNLINTITALEMKNSSKTECRGNTTALDLLSDLSDNDVDTVYKTMELDKEKISDNKQIEKDLDEEDLSIENNYDDFKELEKDLKSNNIAIKIVIIVFVILLLVAAFVFVNKYFKLGLF